MSSAAEQRAARVALWASVIAYIGAALALYLVWWPLVRLVGEPVAQGLALLFSLALIAVGQRFHGWVESSAYARISARR